MASETSPIVRSWFERKLGHALLVSIPIVLTALAGWIWSVEGKITRLEAKAHEDRAQWKVLYENRRKLVELEIQTEVYKKLFSCMIEPKKIQVRVNDPLRDPLKALEDTLRTRKAEVDDFRQQQMRQMRAR